MNPMDIFNLVTSLFSSAGGTNTPNASTGGFTDALNFGTGAANSPIIDPITPQVGGDAFGDARGSMLPGRTLAKSTDGIDFMGGLKDIFSSEGFGPTLQGIAGIGGYFNDSKKMDMMKDLMDKEYKLKLDEIERQKFVYNSQIKDRQHGRTNVVNAQGKPGKSIFHTPVEDYMNENRLA